jgi:hypothetical protein
MNDSNKSVYQDENFCIACGARIQFPGLCEPCREGDRAIQREEARMCSCPMKERY